MPNKSYKVFGVVAASLMALAVAAACGGGGEAPTPTSVPTVAPTSTPVPATATPVPSGAVATATPAPTAAPPTSAATSGGAPAPEPYTGGEEIAATLLDVEMVARGGSGQGGAATLVQIARKTRIRIDIAPGEGGPQLAMIRRGRCPEEGQPASGQADYGLFDVVDGKSDSVVNTPTQFFQFNRDYIVVYGGTTEDNGMAACGNIPSVFG